MAEIISIATVVPRYKHEQKDIIHFMSRAYGLDETEKRKLAFLYNHSGIETRYSVIDDFSQDVAQWDFIPQDIEDDFPSLEERMKIYDREAIQLAKNAVEQCISGFIPAKDITHLITVSCTGMSAPGLDLQLAEDFSLPANTFRTSVNFMGCYAAIHALKLAKMICDSSANANVVIVDVELCTLHFQKEYTTDNAASSLLFSDGAAAVLISNKIQTQNSLTLKNFFSHVAYRGKKDMAWQLSSNGFLMTLSGYVPQLVEEDIQELVASSLKHYNIQKEKITHWCIHPGGKKILQVIEKKLGLSKDDLCYSTTVLSKYGNMSSPTILFVLKAMMTNMQTGANVFGVAFGPGLTMETFLVSKEK